jgi:trigger factor
VPGERRFALSGFERKDGTLETSSKRNDENKIELTVELSADEVKKGIDAAYKEAGKVRIPGFRPGKAPRLVLENHYGGKGYFQAQATDELVKSTFPLAIDGEGFVPLDNPDFEELELVEEGADYSYKLIFTVRPELELSSADPVQIELPSEEPTAEEIDAQVDTKLDYYVDFEDVTGRASKKGDVLYLEMVVRDGDERVEELSGDNLPYELGSGGMPESFEKHLLKLKIDEKREFDFSFSEDGTEDGDIKTLHAEVTLHQLKVKNKPELTDAWVKEKIEFDSVDEFKARIAESIRQQKSADLPSLKERLVAEELASRLVGEPTDLLVTQTEQGIYRDFFNTLQRQNMNFDAFLASANITADQFRDDIKKQATEAATQALALDALARSQGFEITEEELREEFVGSGAPDPDALYKDWADNGRLSEIREGLLRMKAARHLNDTAEVFEPGKKPAAKKTAAKKAPAKKAAEAQDAKAEKAEKPAAKAAKADKATAEKPTEKKTATKAKSAAKKADNND